MLKNEEMITGRNEVVAKVIFLHLSVILFTGWEGVCLSACWDTPPDQTPPPWIRLHPPDQADTTPPLDQTPPPTTPRTRHHHPPDQADTLQHPPDQADPPEADSSIRSTSGGTHPTGMHSCLNNFQQLCKF